MLATLATLTRDTCDTCDICDACGNHDPHATLAQDLLGGSQRGWVARADRRARQDGFPLPAAQAATPGPSHDVRSQNQRHPHLVTMLTILAVIAIRAILAIGTTPLPTSSPPLLRS